MTLSAFSNAGRAGALALMTMALLAGSSGAARAQGPDLPEQFQDAEQNHALWICYDEINGYFNLDSYRRETAKLPGGPDRYAPGMYVPPSQGRNLVLYYFDYRVLNGKKYFDNGSVVVIESDQLNSIALNATVRNGNTFYILRSICSRFEG